MRTTYSGGISHRKDERLAGVQSLAIIEAVDVECDFVEEGHQSNREAGRTFASRYSVRKGHMRLVIS
jgi:hypothetical protein